MNWQVVTHWLKQRPWIVLPILAAIPLVGIPVIHQIVPAVTAPAVAPTPVPKAATVRLPAIAVSPQPQPSETPVAVAQVVPVPSAPLSPKPVAAPRPAAVSAVQPAINLSVDAAIQMRVLLHKAADSLAVSTSAGGGVFDVQSNKLLYEIPPKSNLQMQTDGKQIYLGSATLPPLIWIDPAATGLTYIGDRGYRGKLLVATGGQGLWVVNYINLQQYLYSVVGAEVSPSWPMEALKAQAVAARSYALTYHLKPVKRDLYDLGSDEYFQVYKGVESEATTTRQAVNSTSGEFVSYRGGVVESLYAATDDIVMDAFQGHGMSQIGALGLAEQGHNYRHILSTYYAGTGIARIQMDIE